MNIKNKSRCLLPSGYPTRLGGLTAPQGAYKTIPEYP